MPFKNPHPLYATWQGIKQRCCNPNATSYHRYGGRGINICDRWANDFNQFVSDMGERPNGHTIDRIDNNGDYTPENCRWADARTQQRNKNNAVFVIVEGTKYRAVDLAKKSGLKLEAIVARAEKGLTYAEVVDPQKREDLSGLALGGKANGKRQRAKTHCPKGHPYSGDNLVLSKQGWRGCRTCINAKEARRRERLKGQQ